MKKVFDLSSEYHLSETQIESFRRNGHVYLPEVCSPDEVAYYREAISRIAWQNFPQKKNDERPFLQTLNNSFIAFFKSSVKSNLFALKLFLIKSSNPGS